MTAAKLAELLNDESGMYDDWMVEDVQVTNGKIELTLYDEYTDDDFVSNDKGLLENIVEMLAGERIDIHAYTVAGKTVVAIPA
jgi:hypothetical protein